MLEKLLLRIAGGAFALLGAIGLFLPRWLTETLNILPLSESAWGEVRALSGMWLVMGYITLAGHDSPRGRTMIRGVALVMGGLLLGRIVSLLFDQFFNLVTWVSLVIEAGLIFCLLRGVTYVEETRKSPPDASDSLA